MVVMTELIEWGNMINEIYWVGQDNSILSTLCTKHWWGPNIEFLRYISNFTSHFAHTSVKFLERRVSSSIWRCFSIDFQEIQNVPSTVVVSCEEIVWFPSCVEIVFKPQIWRNGINIIYNQEEYLFKG